MVSHKTSLSKFESVVVVQSLSCIKLFATPWTAVHQASLSFTISRSSLKLVFFESIISSSVRKFGNLCSSHRTGKGQFSFKSQRKATPKNAQTTAQLLASHMLVK